MYLGSIRVPLNHESGHPRQIQKVVLSRDQMIED